MAHRKLNRTTSHRRALRRNLAQSLFEHGQITTTLPKAKDLRPFVEKLITLAKRARDGSSSARSRLMQLLGDRAIIPADHQEAYEVMGDAKRAKVLRSRSGRRHRTGEPKGGLKFTAESVYHRLVNTVAPQFADRPGGYTRVIKLAKARLGDAGATAVLQLIGEEEAPGSVSRPEKTARQRRNDRRYAAVAKGAKGEGKAGGAVVAAEPPAEDQTSPDEPEAEAGTATAEETDTEAPAADEEKDEA